MSERNPDLSDVDQAAFGLGRAAGALRRLRRLLQWAEQREMVVRSELDDAGRRRLAVEDVSALVDALEELPGILRCGGFTDAGPCTREAVALDDIPLDDLDYQSGQSEDVTTEPRCELHRVRTRS